MRYVSSTSPTSMSQNTRQVQRLVAARTVKPVQARARPPEYAEPSRSETTAVAQQEQRTLPQEERRKACRRVQHLPVLVELRSGVERRRHNLRAGDIVEHIDEAV